MEGMIGEIRMFAGNFSPKSWTYCAGQTMAITQNTALFAILGTTYGGDGKQTFGVPDLRGRVAIGQGQGQGLTDRILGATGGAPTTQLTALQMPMHTHIPGGGPVPVSGGITGVMKTNATDGSQTTPENNFLGHDSTGNNLYVPTPGTERLSSAAISVSAQLTATLPTFQASFTGSGIPYNNMQPFLGMSYVLCVYGIFPSRN